MSHQLDIIELLGLFSEVLPLLLGGVPASTCNKGFPIGLIGTQGIRESLSFHKLLKLCKVVLSKSGVEGSDGAGKDLQLINIRILNFLSLISCEPNASQQASESEVVVFLL